jgi:hypothetical protein
MCCERLLAELKLPAEAIGTFTASGGDELGQRALVESFGHADSPLRVLLCSDAASEGVNLHHQCHHLVHYDVPWSIIRLTQRNGRIDRFGQQHSPHLRYLVTRTEATTADQRVVDRLIEKEREVERQLGDPGSLLGLYDAESEETYLVRGVAKGKSADELVPSKPLAAGVASAAIEAPDASDALAGVDLLALLAEVEAEQAKTPPAESLIEEGPSLFRDDYSFLVAALRHLERHPVVGADGLRWDANDADTAITLHAPEPFRRHREGFLPGEAVPKRDQPYRLVMRRDLVMTKLRASLDSEGRWPDWHLLWEQHPLLAQGRAVADDAGRGEAAGRAGDGDRSAGAAGGERSAEGAGAVAQSGRRVGAGAAGGTGGRVVVGGAEGGATGELAGRGERVWAVEAGDGSVGGALGLAADGCGGDAGAQVVDCSDRGRAGRGAERRGRGADCVAGGGGGDGRSRRDGAGGGSVGERARDVCSVAAAFVGSRDGGCGSEKGWV